MLQTQAELIALYECQDKDASRKFICVQTPLLCSLQAMDRRTGENQRQAIWESVRSVPELSRLAADFDFKVRLSTTDRYLANFRSEHGLRVPGYLDQFTLSHFPCDVRKGATCLKQALRPCEMEISGIVNTGLLMSADLGIIKKLRELLVHVFMTELQVHHRGPPPDQNQHRREVFDLFLPLRDVMPGVARTNSKRRWILGHYLNGRLPTSARTFL